MLKTVLKRIKNKKVVLAVVSGIVMILLNLGLIDGAMQEQVLTITNIVLGLGVTLGIFANPDKEKDSTDKVE